MQIKDHLREGIAFNNRIAFAASLVMLALALLAGRLLQLQVVEHEHFTTLSKDNRVKLVPLPPTRGLIYDRNGVLLALNRPAYSLEMVPENVDDIEASRAAVERLGGALITSVKHAEGHGSYCVIRDPAGAVIALFQPE